LLNFDEFVVKDRRREGNLKVRDRNLQKNEKGRGKKVQKILKQILDKIKGPAD
jgi:hypothetical protein